MRRIVLICLGIIFFGIPASWGQSAKSSDPADFPSMLTGIKITPRLIS